MGNFCPFSEKEVVFCGKNGYNGSNVKNTMERM